MGGIGFTFTRSTMKAYVEFSNKGTVHALFSDGTNDPRVEKVETTKAGFATLIERVTTYLYA